MKIVIAPDSFKDSLSAISVCEIVRKSILTVAPDAAIESIPVADGGEGTAQIMAAATGGKLVACRVAGPLGDMVQAHWALLGDGETAVIEMAAASGLALLPGHKRNPLHTTTYGTGQLVLDAVRTGCKKIIVAIGGSATTDFGTGMAQASGVRFIDAHGAEIKEYMCGGLMGNVADIDMTGLAAELHHVQISVACDVTNPLSGEQGAVRVYSPQKGASPADCDVLEHNMAHISALAARQLRDVRTLPGAGAAGGLGGGLVAFLNADLRPGVQLVLETLGFAERIKNADLLITGEGKIDAQTACGKTIAGVCKAAQLQHIPVIAVAGSVDASYTARRKLGLTACFSLCNRPMTLESAIDNAENLLYNVTGEIMQVFIHLRKTGEEC